MTRSPRKLRKFPYFKVQSRDHVSLVWKDHHKEAFDDLAAAEAYRKIVPAGVETRVVKWERSGSEPIRDNA